MPASIGIRVYELTARKKGNRAPIPLSSPELATPTPRFLSEFVAAHLAAVQNQELERTWYFAPKDDNGTGNSRGYLHYGTFGFESDLVNSKTKTRNYRRQVDDVEEIPLFYEFWCPTGGDFALSAFQSFQSRSCIALVMNKMREHFETRNPGYTLGFRKLMPNDVKGSFYYSAPVKRLSLIKRNAPPDVTDRYFSGAPTEVDFEVSLTARRSRSLGDLASVTKSLAKNAAGIVVHEGIAFNEAVAFVQVGGRQRRVGVFGSDSEAGVIDLSDVVKRGPDGHPTFASLVQHSDEILQDFYEVLTG